MAGRALVFSNATVIERIRKSFVAYAGDQWYLHRQQDADGKFFWKIAQEGHNKDLPDDSTRQGLYIASADGTFLASDCFRPSVQKFLELLDSGQKRWRETGGKAIPEPESPLADPSYERQPPKGGTILNVYTRIPLTFQPPKDGSGWNPNQSIGRDHLWMTAEEGSALGKTVDEILARRKPSDSGGSFAVPNSLAMRIARFHLIDNVRGEPSFWNRAHVRHVELKLRLEDAAKHLVRLDGLASLATNLGERGYECRIQGRLAYDPPTRRFSRLDLLAWGESWGEGTYTRGAPSGRFPLVVAFSLAGNTPADRVPPQAARSVSEYFNP